MRLGKMRCIQISHHGSNMLAYSALEGEQLLPGVTRLYAK
jgi:hypothetical protein